MNEIDVESFLKSFKEKLQIWDILYRDDRGKNAKTLLKLELPPFQRTEVLKNLDTKDYSEGPLADTLHSGPDMWVFGKTVHKQEIYIKISMGFPGASVICISVHIAEHPMKYPLK